MVRYNEEFKEQAVRRLMPPNAQSVAQVRRDIGVSDVTLYNWRNQYRERGNAVPADPSNPENWNGKNKLAVVIETAGRNPPKASRTNVRDLLLPCHFDPIRTSLRETPREILCMNAT